MRGSPPTDGIPPIYRGKDRTVAIVLGFEHPEFHGEIIAVKERLRASDAVRVIDSLAVDCS
jgi:hypothetical protein